LIRLIETDERELMLNENIVVTMSKEIKLFLTMLICKE